MWLFFVLLACSLLLSALLRPSISVQGRKIYIILMFSAFAFMMMFKSSSVGNDTVSYIQIFNYVNGNLDLRQIISGARYEPGFLLYVKLITILFNNVQWVFIISGVFIAYSFGRFIHRYSMSPAYSVWIFLTLQFFDLCMSNIRQAMAISILMLAYEYLLTKRNVRFFISVVIATLFHTSSFLFAVLFFLQGIKNKKKFYYYSAAIIVAIYFMFESLVIPLIGRFFPVYLHYFTSSSYSYSNQTTLANVLMTVLFLLIFILIRILDRYGHGATNIGNTYDDSGCSVYDNMLEMDYINELAIWFGVLMLFLSWQGTILNRYKFVFSFVVLAALPNSLYKSSSRSNRFILMIITGFVFLAYILTIYYFRPEWQSTYPFIPFWR